MSARALAAVGLLPLALTAQAPGRNQQAPASLLATLALAEDGRGRRTGAPRIDPLLEGLSHPSAEIRSVAVRGLGRLQDPQHAARIAGLFSDSSETVRVGAINAFAQAHQGLRASEPAARRESIAQAISTLAATGGRTTSAPMRAIVARSIGRLPHADSAQARAAERAIVALVAPQVQDRVALAEGILHGLYSLARIRRTHGPLTVIAVDAIRGLAAARVPSRDPDGVEAERRVRRLALLALTANGTSDLDVLRDALLDEDEQVRRLAVVRLGTRILGSASERSAALAYPSWLVRLERVRALRALPSGEGCRFLIGAPRDASPHVALAVIDALPTQCAGNQEAIDRLTALLSETAANDTSRSAGQTSWHQHAHALVALARLAPEAARAPLARSATARPWPVRVYAARAAAVLADTSLLRRLARDDHGNVQEAALGGLRQVVGHAATAEFVSALASPHYHVVLAAAEALRGAPGGADLVPALLRSLERLTREQRETSRDPREALLSRIGELGGPATVSALDPYLADFDSTIAMQAAALASRWSGRTVAARPTIQQPPADPVVEVLSGPFELVVHMAPGSGGGSFTILLDTRTAPVTSARLVRLARAGHYNGLTFHRVEPGFVIQGGSPAATEYVGDGPFLRDELGTTSHLRGTVGISTRGRDTGDAQIFVNLVDNFRLDHDYTVVGSIVRGQEVAEGVLEADVIERVEVRRAR